METNYEKSLNILTKFLKETSPENVQKIIDVLNNPLVVAPAVPTDYDRFLDTLYSTLSEQETEYLEYTDGQLKKDAEWEKEYFGLPANTKKGIYIYLRGYKLFFNDNKDYIGYAHGLVKNGFKPEEKCSVIPELKNI